MRLAARMPISEVGVAELTREAGISRVTFYDHYESPLDALVEALTEELDAIRRVDTAAHIAAEHPGLQIETESMARLAEHVLEFRAVYEQALLSGPKATLHYVLKDYFEQAQMEYLERTALPNIPVGVSHRAAANYIAHGMVGSIELWLERGRETGRYVVPELVAVITALRPEWWR
ncbi:hypothetical protein BH09ACT6_BH09ACT6_16350 [soil metagenome]